MKLINNIIVSVMAAATLSMSAQTADYNTMYLIKGDRVVGKYGVDEVDYASFKLPQGVIADEIWLNVDNVGKNNVTYTVNTLESTTIYAHGIVPYCEANYIALDSFGMPIDDLSPDERLQVLQSYLPYVGYLGVGTITATMKDYAEDGLGSRFSVIPGYKYYLCAWEVDPVTQRPLNTFVYTEFKTLDPGESSATLDVSFKRQNEEGLAFNVTGSDDILYVMTAYGIKSVMEAYIGVYGMDYLMGTFGQKMTISSLQGEGDLGNGIEAATWPAYDSGEYVLYVRGYDAQGDMIEAEATAIFEAPENEGPEINILDRSKNADGTVSVNFEVVPSNVSEAYVRLMTENDVDDYVNDGWELYELASTSQATDIYDDIRANGEYTFRAENLSEEWYSLLIYARDADGARTVQRISFNILPGSEWYDYAPVHVKSLRKAAKRGMAKSRRPAFDRVK